MMMMFLLCQDELKEERIAKRNLELETCSNNVKLLAEMLTQYSKNTSQTEKGLMRVGNVKLLYSPER